MPRSPGLSSRDACQVARNCTEFHITIAEGADHLVVIHLDIFLLLNKITKIIAVGCNMVSTQPVLHPFLALSGFCQSQESRGYCHHRSLEDASLAFFHSLDSPWRCVQVFALESSHFLLNVLLILSLLSSLPDSSKWLPLPQGRHLH